MDKYEVFHNFLMWNFPIKWIKLCKRNENISIIGKRKLYKHVIWASIENKSHSTIKIAGINNAVLLLLW